MRLLIYAGNNIPLTIVAQYPVSGTPRDYSVLYESSCILSGAIVCQFMTPEKIALFGPHDLRTSCRSTDTAEGPQGRLMQDICRSRRTFCGSHANLRSPHAQYLHILHDCLLIRCCLKIIEVGIPPLVLQSNAYTSCTAI